MPEYADGVHTNYAWPSLTCPAVKAIQARVAANQAERVARAKAATDALAARVKAADAAAKALASLTK